MTALDHIHGVLADTLKQWGVGTRADLDTAKHGGTARLQ